MRKNIAILFFMISWVILTTVGLLWGFNYDWPDFVHVDYGLPLTWATNTLSTFAGPANFWEVNMLYLLFDLIFWLAIMVAAVVVIHYKLKD